MENIPIFVNAGALIAMFAWVYGAMARTADKPNGSVVAEEMRARTVRDEKIFSKLDGIKEDVAKVQTNVATLGTRMEHVERHLKLNGHGHAEA